jgi:hypothetical protein
MENKGIMRYHLIPLLVVLALFLEVAPVQAQRLGHGASRSRTMAAPHRNTGNMNANRSINGGSHRATNRSRPSTRDISRPSGNAGATNRIPSASGTTRDQTTNRNPSAGTRDRVSGNGNRVSGNGNRVNIDNSRRNVNIRNTNVRVNANVYVRPPYRYGGWGFYCYHPYYYHPFRPFYWGPVWHPWGFFITTLAVTAVVVSVNNQPYYYDQGVYYVESNGGYTVVQAPEGAVIKELPKNTQEVVVNETTNNYYYGGTYYEEAPGGFKVVPPTAGTVVENLPEGAEEVRMGEQTYVQYGDIYYQPVQVDGKNMYEVVNLKEEGDSE